MKKILKNNPYVQSPLWPEVHAILNNIKISDSYYVRGSKLATTDLKRTVNNHRNWISEYIDLEEFKYCYVTSGATEAISNWQASETREWQILEGDYQWANLITNSGEVVKEINDKVLYLSNPHCPTGNYLDNSFIDSLECPVIYDCAYLGASKKHKVSIPKNAEQVMFSFSKGWGLIGQRCGLVYTKEPHPVFDPLQKVECWNYATTLIIESIIDNFTPDFMYNQFKETQQMLCNKYDLTPSDVYFIATSEDEYYTIRRRIGNTARLCLTPLIKN